MSVVPSFRLITITCVACLGLGLPACQPPKPPQLTVIGSSPTDNADEVVFVQVTNPASRPMKLTKLEYTFAADSGTTVSQGELELSRDVPAGAAVVVEVPLENPTPGPVTLTGTLTAQLDQIIQSFQVSAKIQPR
jgi:hypothetical protein